MKKGQSVDQEIKELIIKKVKEGIPIDQLAREYNLYGIPHSTPTLTN
jgi:hypothetical protein